MSLSWKSSIRLCIAASREPEAICPIAVVRPLIAAMTASASDLVTLGVLAGSGVVR